MTNCLADEFPHTELLKEALRSDVERALAEDVGSGDLSAQLIDPSATADARVISREHGVFCGVPWVSEICQQSAGAFDVEWLTQDGATIAANTELLRLRGSARTLLTIERTMLNFLQLLSGTATAAHKFAELIRDYPTQLLDTRKTIPGLRLAQKFAVFCGGAHNHRIGLFDAYLLKENHIAAAGGIAPAIARAQAMAPGRTVEIEVESLAELDVAIAAGADIVMLDNFTLGETRAAVEQAAGRTRLEASGNITEDTITEIAATGVDYISVGAITKRVTPLDLSMRFV